MALRGSAVRARLAPYYYDQTDSIPYKWVIFPCDYSQGKEDLKKACMIWVIVLDL